MKPDRYIFSIISRSVLLTIRNISDKSCRETQNTHFVCNNIFFENRAVYEIMRKNTADQDRPQMTTRRTRISLRLPKATD